MFSLARRDAAEFGTAVHGLLAEVEWRGEEEIRRLELVWNARNLPAEIVGEALACLREPALASVWLMPRMLDQFRTRSEILSGETFEVWREKTFEVALDGAWITGIFDRVIVHRDAAGKAVAAVIIDFKTDHIGPDESLKLAVARHAAQLNLYRQVAATLTRLPIEAVACQLVFTRLRRMVGVSPS
jgi:ATP-dependent helicase/nuclease subunit A